jgi:hypothetical protein
MDADVEFVDSKWHVKCSKLLDKHAVVQPHTGFVFMEEHETPRTRFAKSRTLKAFAVEAMRRSVSRPSARPIDFHRNHPGYAWAARASTLAAMGGFFTWAICGHGDIVMAAAFADHAGTRECMWDPAQHALGVYFRDWSPQLVRAAKAWQSRASSLLKTSCGAHAEPVVAYHWWHGTTESRGYLDRGKLLAEYDPCKHTVLSKDTGGITWTEAAPARMREQIDAYFAERASQQRAASPQ